ncbi:MAG: TIGR03759 family integrating conjugative element protein [Blastocatellia bacterium]
MTAKIVLRRLAIGTLAVLSAISMTGADDTPSSLSTADQSRSRQSLPERFESRFSREQWGLDETEWQRYLTLMQGVRGSISPSTLSPIEVLGVHARDDPERMRYARLWANIRREDAERILAFQAAYDAAWWELNPSGQIIDLNNLPRSDVNDQAVQNGDRVLLFLRLEDCPDCQTLYTRVRRAAHEADAQFDIFFTDTKPGKDDPALREWIAGNRFDSESRRIRQKKITVNHDNGALNRAGGPAAKAPAAFRIRSEIIDPLQIGMPGL